MRWELLTGAVTYLLQTPAITFPQEVGEQVAALASELRVAVLPCISKRVIGGLAGGWRGGCARLLPALGETGCAMGRRRARVSRAPTQNPRPDAAFGMGQRWVPAAMAPAAAPMASHLALRAMRRRALPPLAARTAASRSWVRTAVLARSSVRSAWAAASLAWQARQSREKS